VTMIWFEHYLFFRRYDLHDFPSIALTFVLLFLVVGFAYPLKLVFTHMAIMAFGPIGELDKDAIDRGGDSASQVLLVYSLAFCAVYCTLALLYRQGMRRRADLELDEREVFLTRSSIVGLQSMFAVGLLSVAFCLIGLLQGAGANVPFEERPFLERYGVAGWVYFLIGPVMTVHGAWEGRHLRLLTAQPEPEAPETGAPAA
jgi:hypothetical protein